MNLIQQADQLKSLPDQALAQMQQRPTDVPPYLIVAEMQRRASMRKAFQGAQAQAMPQQPPVAQQLAQPMQQQAAPPMQMAGGGAVKPQPSGLASLAGYFAQMQGGGDGGNELGVADMTPYFAGMAGQQDMPDIDSEMIGANDFSPYSTMNDASHNAFRQQMKVPLNKARGVAANLKELRELTGESPLKAVADKYGADEEKYRDKKMGLGEILMNLGLTMAASRRPDFLGALGEGGVGALSGWRQDKDRNVALANQAAGKRLQAMEGIQRHNDRLQDYAIDANRTEQSAYNVDRQYNNSIESMLQKEVLTGDRERSMMDRQAALQGSMDARERAKDDARYQRELALQFLKQGHALEVEKVRSSRPRPGGGGDSSKEMDKGLRNLNTLYDDLAKSADHYEAMAEKIQPLTNKPDDVGRLRQAELRARADEFRQRAQSILEQRTEAMEESIPGMSKKRKGGSDLGTGALEGLGKLVDLRTFGRGTTRTPDYNPNAATYTLPPPPKPQPKQFDGRIATGSWDQQPSVSFRDSLPWNRR